MVGLGSSIKVIFEEDENRYVSLGANKQIEK